MEYVAVILLAAAVFGVCFLVDRGFARIFRSQAQHLSGKAVRLNKKYGSVGLILGVLGLAAIFSGLQTGWLMIVAGGLLVAVGIGLVIYYLTFGVFYDDDGFVLSTFGRRSVTYGYGDIQAQQLYISARSIVVELHLADGRTLQLQLAMKGATEFLDHAYSRWLEKTGRKPEECTFHNTENSCWFPPAE